MVGTITKPSSRPIHYWLDTWVIERQLRAAARTGELIVITTDVYLVWQIIRSMHNLVKSQRALPPIKSGKLEAQFLGGQYCIWVELVISTRKLSGHGMSTSYAIAEWEAFRMAYARIFSQTYSPLNPIRRPLPPKVMEVTRQSGPAQPDAQTQPGAPAAKTPWLRRWMGNWKAFWALNWLKKWRH